jgi:feruloyl esterase
MGIRRLSILAVACWVPLAAADCAALAKLTLPATTITTAETVAGGSFKPAGAGTLNKLPSFCRVAGVIKPSADSDIRFEVWLPSEGWNGKFQGVGNGGFAGVINWMGLAAALRGGYATASTDTGHQAGGTDALWALNHPEKIVDFGHRAIHEMTVQGKAITKAFYGSAPKRSYFNSCSNGGRQALMEAQRYPEDYDGIIAGAPANYWIYLLTTAARNIKATVGTEGAYIPSAKLPAIQAAARKACDASDGSTDNLVGDPGACRFDPSVLACQGAENDQCLTPPQLKALRTLYDGLRDPKGKLLFPGYSPGGEAEPGGWGQWITGSAPERSLLFAFGTNFFKYMLYNDPNWDYKTFDLQKDLAAAQKKLSPILDSADPDLSKFAARGGKLLLFHGWCDAAIPPAAAIQYYESVQKKMGARRVAEFVRLYMVPGMQHCGGGSGPSNFDQNGVGNGDPASSMPSALEAWVERGVAPGSIVASGPQGLKRPLCPHPQVARQKTSGDFKDPANFACVAAGR